jgi:Family of unknown function (DUF6529)
VEQLIEDLTRRNVTEVKVVLASVVLALAVYQVVLAAVFYGRLRPPFLAAPSASAAASAGCFLCSGSRCSCSSRSPGSPPQATS